MIYLDNASTTFVLDVCIQMITQDLANNWGNPSNNYTFSDLPKKRIEGAKKQIAKSINCDPEEIYFTSGASEGNAWGMSQASEVYCSHYEHHNYLENPKVIMVSEDFFEEEWYKHKIQQSKISEDQVYAHILVSNETGEDFTEVCKNNFSKAKQIGMFTLCDCTQALGNVVVDVKELGCDMAIFSGHKVHGPKGIGFVYINKEMNKYVKPLIFGTQQHGLRGGTENVAYINALGYAVWLSELTRVAKQTAYNDYKDIIQSKLYDSGIDYKVLTPENSSSAIFSIALANVESEVLQAMLNDKDIYIGTGSGCANGLMEKSHTLETMGIEKRYINGLIRFSFSERLVKQDVITAVDALIEAYLEIVD